MEVETYTYDEESPESVELYELIKSWAPDCFPPPHLLPKLGVITRDKGEVVSFVCADMSNSIPRAYLDYLRADPEVSFMIRYKAIKMAERFICLDLKRMGYQVITAMTTKAGIASLSQRMGYWVNPKGMTYLCKEIE